MQSEQEREADFVSEALACRNQISMECEGLSGDDLKTCKRQIEPDMKDCHDICMDQCTEEYGCALGNWRCTVNRDRTCLTTIESL